MGKNTTKAGDLTIGIDLGDKKSHFHILTADREDLGEGTVSMQVGKMRDFFSGFAPSTVIIEAGAQSIWVERSAKESGHEVIVANPRRLDLITKSIQKTDRKDAHILASLAQSGLGLLSTVQQRSESSQVDTALFEARKLIVSQRSQTINHVRGKLKEFGIRLPQSMTAYTSIQKAKKETPANLQLALFPLLDHIQELNRQVKEFDKQLQKLATKSYPETQRLQQIVGVGPLTSLYFVLKIGDPTRFIRSRDVGAYLGLVPKSRQSGKQNPQLGITKAGDREMRCLLMQAAHYILGPFGPECDLRRFGERLLARGGKVAKKRALVAVARKLACLMHHLWAQKLDYDPDYLLKRQAAA